MNIQGEIQREAAMIGSLLTDEQWALYGEYFSEGLGKELTYPKECYDCIIFRSKDEIPYYYGTVAAHAYDSLIDDGYFIFNVTGTAHDIDVLINLFSLFFTYLDKESKDNFYVFQK